MATKNVEMILSYDQTHDVLYISYSEPKEAITIEQDDGTLLRLDPETREPVGLTVFDFTKRAGMEVPSKVRLSFPVPS